MKAAWAMIPTSSSLSSAGGGSQDLGGVGYSAGPGLPDVFPRPEYTDVEKGIAWLKVTFGCVYMAVGLATLGWFFHVRKEFEIKARSPYLVMMNAVAILALLGLYSYQAALVLDDTLPIDTEDIVIVSFFMGFLFVGSFLARCFRLRMAYWPALRRRFPWLLSENLLLCAAVLFGLAGTTIPLYRVYTINGPFAMLTFLSTIEDDEELWAWVLFGLVLVFVPLVWPVDDIFRISTEMLLVIGFHTLQTLGNYLTDKYASLEASYWINKENIPYVGAVIMYGLSVIDPLRRFVFNPVAKTYPALARAQNARREDALRALKKNDLSELTLQESVQHSESASSTDMGTPKRPKWCYESLAAVPELAAAFRAFAFRALCQESVLFLEDVKKYQNGDFSEWSADGDRDRKPCFLAIAARYIADGSPDEVNISASDKKKIIDLSRNKGNRFDMLNEDEKLTVFGEAYVEIRYMLETNLLQRFTDSQELNDRKLVEVQPPQPTHRRTRRVKTCDDEEVHVAMRSGNRIFGFSDEIDEEQPQECGGSFAY